MKPTLLEPDRVHDQESQGHIRNAEADRGKVECNAQPHPNAACRCEPDRDRKCDLEDEDGVGEYSSNDRATRQECWAIIRISGHDTHGKPVRPLVAAQFMDGRDTVRQDQLQANDPEGSGAEYGLSFLSHSIGW